MQGEIDHRGGARNLTGVSEKILSVGDGRSTFRCGSSFLECQTKSYPTEVVDNSSVVAPKTPQHPNNRGAIKKINSILSDHLGVYQLQKRLEPESQHGSHSLRTITPYIWSRFSLYPKFFLVYACDNGTL